MFMANNPLISIIVPVYNVENYLCECIDSIRKQTYSNIEIILVDDGSTDRSGDICDEYAKIDSRIIVVHKNNGGLSSARNTGLEIASGNYIGFVDSDDFIEQTMYEKLINGFNYADNIGITSCSIYRYANGVIKPYKSAWDVKRHRTVRYESFAKEVLPCKINFTVWSKLFKREIINDVKFRIGRINEDTLYMFDISKELELRQLDMVEIPHSLYYYRMRDGSICSDRSKLEIAVIQNFKEIEAYYKAHERSIEEYIMRKYYTVILIDIAYRIRRLPENKKLYNRDIICEIDKINYNIALKCGCKSFVKYILSQL